ncbi:alpha/beta hydrolase [Metallumcola ferriviriculae]|uniref:Alpha/beta hydrolase n=1 Tax=Metallumcola ferriviriculae TaxID=3039180 RepID=A0AAU0UTS3_9FIRM|nr:alpha/beta hydrolase [Desulfitibacteraceae bacterium MK1]
MRYRTVQGKNGHNIPCFSAVPKGAKAIITISHGFRGHAGQYNQLADCLIANKYGVYALDHRGHGRAPGEKGHITTYLDFVADMQTLVDFITMEHKLPIFTFGHSMGGLITFLYGIKYPEKIKGQIFSAPALGLPWGTSIIPRWLYGFACKYFSKLRVYPVVSRSASRNEEFLRGLKKDPYVLKYATVGFFCEFFKAISWAKENDRDYRLPCLVLHGKDDKIIPFNRSEEIIKRIPAADKTLKLFPGFYHELMQEPGSCELREIILHWLKARA